MRYKLHIPFVNRPDLLLDCVKSLRDIGHIHVWCDAVAAPAGLTTNTQVSEYAVEKVHHLPLLSFTGVMNMLIQSSWDDDVMLFGHNDGIAADGAARRFLEFVEVTRARGIKWGAIFTCYDVLAAFNMDAVREVGYFDPMFFQYTSDIDYYRRLVVAGWREVNMANHGITHRNHASNTIKADPIFNHVTQWRAQTNFDKKYYAEKWGGMPGQERYLRPFQKLAA